jgi:hypothetical protein
VKKVSANKLKSKKGILRSFLESKPAIDILAKEELTNLTLELNKKFLIEKSEKHKEELSNLWMNLPLLEVTQKLSAKTYPKYPSIIVFLEHLATTKTIPVIINLKIFCSAGIHYKKIIHGNKPTNGLSPIMLIDAVCSLRGDIKTMAHVIDKTSQCSSIYHKPTKDHITCVCCQLHQEECVLNTLAIDSLLENHGFETIMKIIAASFMTHYQQGSLDVCQKNCPQIHQEFQEMCKKTNEFGLSTNNISGMFIEHMYPSTWQYHTKKTWRLGDCSIQQIISLDLNEN